MERLRNWLSLGCESEAMNGGGIDFERSFDLKNERLLVYVKVMGENIKPKTLAILINNNLSWDQVTAEWYRG